MIAAAGHLAWAIGVAGLVLLPLLLAAGLLHLASRRLCLMLAPWAALPGLLLALLMPADLVIEAPWLLFGGRFGVDETGRAFLLFTALLWWLSGLFGLRYLADDPRRWQFFVYYLLAMSGSLGVNVCLDPASYFVLFALMSFSSYGLVVHAGDAEALRAGRVYIALVVLGEVLLISAIAVMLNSGGEGLPYRNAEAPAVFIALVLLGFGIKAGALPLHVWLPLAHPAAPVPASAVLSGAMIKAGLLGWLRFLPLGAITAPDWGLVCAAAGLAAAFYAAAVGVTQRNPKTVLAYSSISQMGLMTVPVGIALAVPEAWPAALSAVLIYALHHGLAKGALFLGVGVASHAGGLRGPVLLALLLPALALAGLPLTSGAVAKVALKGAVAGADPAWIAWLAVLLPLAAVGTTLLMARFLITLRTTAAGHHARASGLWPSWLALLVLVAALIWSWPLAHDAAAASLKADKLWPAVWPVLAGVLLAGLAWRLSARRARPTPQVPPGDLLLAFDALVPGWLRFWSAARWQRAWQRWLELLDPPAWRDRGMGLAEAVASGELRLRDWPVAGAVFMALLLLLFLLGWLGVSP